MLTSTIHFLRNTISQHPGFSQALKDRISQNGRYDITNCTPNTLKWLAFQLNIPFHDKDGRGRPPKKPVDKDPLYQGGAFVNTGWTQPTEPVAPISPDPVVNESISITPEPKAPKSGLDAIIHAMIQEALHGFDPQLNEEKVISLIAQHGQTIIKRPINIYPNPTATIPTFIIEDGDYHYRFPLVLSAVQLHLNVYLVGPTGSGKTHMCEQIAKALAVPFFGFAAMSSEYKMSGFTDAMGRIVHTQFRKAYTEGGVACLDEIDAYSPNALLALNAALANGWAEFPDGMLPRHPDFYCVAGANTIGLGASRDYVGRVQLDAASINRFLFIDLPYDPHLEAAMVGAECYDKKTLYSFTPRTMTSHDATRIYNLMRAIRAEAQTQSVKLIVSPRSTQMACKLYAAGWNVNDILDCAVWKGLDKDTQSKLMSPDVCKAFDALLS